MYCYTVGVKSRPQAPVGVSRPLPRNFGLFFVVLHVSRVGSAVHAEPVKMLLSLSVSIG